MKTDCLIRSFVPNDYPEVSRIWQAIFPDPVDQIDTEEYIRRFIIHNHGLSFVAEKDCRIVGTVLAGHDTRRGYIYHLGVLPDFRRRGIGKALLDAAEKSLASQGIEKAHLFVFQENRTALSFYEDVGYKLRDDINVCSKVLERKKRFVIEPIRPDEAEAVSRMIEDVFDRFVGPGYSDEGKTTFKQFIVPGEMTQRLTNGNFMLTAKDGERVMGVIEMKALNHISLFFVDPEYQRQGVARRLWETVLRRCLQLRAGGAGFTVNSSPYAVPIYQKLGFAITGPEQVINGIRFTPMIYNVNL